MNQVIREYMEDFMVSAMSLFMFNRFYIILQGSVNIYRLDEDSSKKIELPFDTVTEFAKLDGDPEKREQLINQTFGNFVITLRKA